MALREKENKKLNRNIAVSLTSDSALNLKHTILFLFNYIRIQELNIFCSLNVNVITILRDNFNSICYVHRMR